MDNKKVYGTMRIGAIIPTLKGRELFLKFTLERMANQTVRIDSILIDAKKKNYIDIAEKYERGLSQLFSNGCDVAMMIEDDDYYPLTYVESMVRQWEKVGKPPVMGLNKTIYYHIFEKKYRVFDNKKHCAAFSTLVYRNAKFINICKRDNPCYDVELYRNNHYVFTNIQDYPVGIKHGIGKTGGSFHDGRKYVDEDSDLIYFKSIIDANSQSFYIKNFICE